MGQHCMHTIAVMDQTHSAAQPASHTVPECLLDQPRLSFLHCSSPFYFFSGFNTKSFLETGIISPLLIARIILWEILSTNLYRYYLVQEHSWSKYLLTGEGLPSAREHGHTSSGWHESVLQILGRNKGTKWGFLGMWCCQSVPAVLALGTPSAEAKFPHAFTAPISICSGGCLPNLQGPFASVQSESYLHKFLFLSHTHSPKSFTLEVQTFFWRSDYNTHRHLLVD